MQFAATNRGFAVALALSGVLSAGTPAIAEEGVAHLNGWITKSASYPFEGSFLRIQWTGETPEVELAAYSVIARQDGDQALRNELAIKDLGRLSVDGEIGRPIAIVHETRNEGMRRLLIVVPRDVSTQELFLSKTSTARYPYLVFDVTLDADGIGEGELHPLARLAVSPDGKISYETYQPLPLRVLRVEAS